MAERRKIAIDLIDADDRLRRVDPDKALLLAASMKVDGQRYPIEVRPVGKKGRYALISGGHRLGGAKLLEWTEIDAEILDITADQARMREIDENLYRAELSDLDRAVFLSEKKRLYEKLNPQAKHGGDRRSEQVAIFGDLLPRFTEEACERLGCSERTLQRIIARAAIVPDVRDRIAGTSIANTGSELDALARLSPEEQRSAVQWALSDGVPAMGIAAAVKQMRGDGAAGAPVDETDAQYAALLKGWRRADRRARDRFLSYLKSEGETSGEQRDAA
ncbi:ParB N-terminal domain-containing protein [Xanthobacter sp. DSM 24535]|uniref:ParB N-terminal domain-containing protein n=1 Tax=Roseixanthobacter psychrophilus TaxID=3119917 RepID=UPI00372AEE6A